MSSQIEFEQTPSGGRIFIPGSVDGRESELVFVTRGEVWDAISTFVPPSQRGQGIAGKLVDQLITEARRQNKKIRPTCPYIKVKFDRHPDWSDLRDGDAA